MGNNMRACINFIVMTLLIIFVSPGIVYSQDSSEAKLLKTSQLLYPVSRNWKDFNSFPILNEQQIEKFEPAMRSLYMKSKHYDWMGDPSCLVNRLFAKDENKKKLRFFDINGDGNKDIVYSDDTMCAEGNITIIWFGSKNGLDQTTPLIRSVKILKIESSGGPRITSVKVGCCGDPISEFFIGDIFIPSKTSVAYIFNLMTLPENLKISSSQFQASKEITLRYSPIKDDTYNKDMSEFVSHAVFGNIVAKYLQGAKGELVATYHDNSGIKWGLLIMDATSYVFLFYNPYKANVGWTVIE